MGFRNLLGRARRQPAGLEKRQIGVQRHRMARPWLGLNGSKDLLFFGAGLGGSARLLAETCDVRVEGWEPDPSVVAASGGGVRAYNPEEQKTGDKTFDYVFSKEAFFTIADKDELFDTFAGSSGTAGACRTRR